jgi:hypothetical protein
MHACARALLRAPTTCCRPCTPPNPIQSNPIQARGAAHNPATQGPRAGSSAPRTVDGGGRVHLQAMNPLRVHPQQVHDELRCDRGGVDGAVAPVLCDACIMVCGQGGWREAACARCSTCSIAWWTLLALICSGGSHGRQGVERQRHGFLSHLCMRVVMAAAQTPAPPCGGLPAWPARATGVQGWVGCGRVRVVVVQAFVA